MSITVNEVKKVKKVRTKKQEPQDTISVPVLRNRNGKPVPVTQLSAYIRRRDKAVKDIMREVEKLEAHMRAKKALIKSKVDKIISYAAESKDYNKELNVAGNLQLSDYGCLLLVEMKRGDIIEFDERLNTAKGIIDNLLKQWTGEGMNENLRQIISEAFNMDKKGSLNKAMIIKMTQLPIKHPDWDKAVTLIRESMNVKGTRDYMQFKKRDTYQGEYKRINLDFGSL